MDPNDKIGEVLEQGANAVKQTVKTVAAQVGVASDSPQAATSQDANTQDVVESLYEKSQSQAAAQSSTPASNSSNTQNKSPQELAQIEVVRKNLHEQYYQSLINPPKEQQEESVSEKLEREEKQEMVDLQQKQMEKPPELVQRAAQRVEKFPGASG